MLAGLHCYRVRPHAPQTRSYISAIERGACMRRLQVIADCCTGCRSCEVACSLVHSGSCWPKEARLWIEPKENATAFTPRICRRCRRPRCAAVCPSGALVPLPEGGAKVDPEKCTGCGACVKACPFGYLRLSPITNVPLICDLCLDRPEGPACAETCGEKAVVVKET